MTTIRVLSLAILSGSLVATDATAQAQPSPETAAITAVVTRVFDGMKEADSAKVRSAFAPGARFVTVGTRANPDTITYMAVDGWITSIANSNKAWDERVKNIHIDVDGNIATAWMDYTFYLNGAVRHCGMNSFTFAKVRGEWKVTQLADTRRTTGC